MVMTLELRKVSFDSYVRQKLVQLVRLSRAVAVASFICGCGTVRWFQLVVVAAAAVFTFLDNMLLCFKYKLHHEAAGVTDQRFALRRNGQ